MGRICLCVECGGLLAASDGLADVDPIGDAVAGAFVAVGLHEGLQQHRSVTVALPLVPQLGVGRSGLDDLQPQRRQFVHRLRQWRLRVAARGRQFDQAIDLHAQHRHAATARPPASGKACGCPCSQRRTCSFQCRDVISRPCMLAAKTADHSLPEP